MIFVSIVRSEDSNFYLHFVFVNTTVGQSFKHYCFNMLKIEEEVPLLKRRMLYLRQHLDKKEMSDYLNNIFKQNFNDT